MGGITGKYAIVTGGGKGIGAAVARRFAAEGAAGWPGRPPHRWEKT